MIGIRTRNSGEGDPRSWRATGHQTLCRKAVMKAASAHSWTALPGLRSSRIR